MALLAGLGVLGLMLMNGAGLLLNTVVDVEALQFWILERGWAPETTFFAYSMAMSAVEVVSAVLITAAIFSGRDAP